MHFNYIFNYIKNMKKAIFLVVILLNVSFLVAQENKEAEARKKIIRHILEEKWRFRGEVPISNYQPQASGNKVETLLSEQFISGETNTQIQEAEAFIAINPTDSNNLVLSFMRQDPNNFQASLTFPVYFSLDGGNTWELSDMDSKAIFDQDYPGAFIAGGGDPVFAFDKNGKLYFSWIYLGISNFTTLTGEMSMNWAYSLDKGATFQVSPGSQHFIGRGSLNLVTQELGPDFDGVFDRQWMDVDRSGGANDGRLYVSALFVPNATTALAGNGTIVKFKEATVDSFSTIHLPVATTPNSQFSNLIVSENGTVHVSFATLDSNNIAVYHAKSSNGMPFTTVKVADANDLFKVGVHDRANAAVSLGVYKQNVFIAWSDSTTAGTRGFFAVSKDNGDSWTHTDIATLVPDAGTICLMPTVAVNQQGHVTLAWYNQNLAGQYVYYTAVSTDDGTTFTNSTPVASAATDFSAYQSTEFFGDYYNTITHNCKSYSVWSDGRNQSGPKMYFAIINQCENSVGIPDINPVTNLISVQTIYPNPVKEKAFIQIYAEKETPIKVEWKTTEGKSLSSQSYNLPPGKQTLFMDGLAQLSSGLYILTIETPYGTFVRKVVKE